MVFDGGSLPNLGLRTVEKDMLGSKRLGSSTARPLVVQ